MRLFVNLNNGFVQLDRKFPQHIGVNTTVDWQVPMFTTERLEVGFCRTELANTVNLGATPALTLRVKRSTGDNRFDEPELLMVGTWAQFTEANPTGGTDYFHAADLPLNAAALQKMLGVDWAEQREQITIECVDDVGGSLGGKYFDLYTSETTYYRVWMDTGSDVAPAAGTGGTLLEVNINADDVANDIAFALASAMDAALTATWNFTATDEVISGEAVNPVKMGFHDRRNSGFAITTDLAGMSGANQTADEEEVELMCELTYEFEGQNRKARIFPLLLLNSLERPGGSENPALGSPTRRGTVAIGSGVSSVTATFSTPFSAATWKFRDLQIVNTADAAPENIFPGIVTARTAAGFTVKLNGDTPTTNYFLEYSCEA